MPAAIAAASWNAVAEVVRMGVRVSQPRPGPATAADAQRMPRAGSSGVTVTRTRTRLPGSTGSRDM